MSIVLNGTGGTISGVPGQVLQIVTGVLDTGDTNVDWTSAGASFGTFSITPKQSTSRIVGIMNGNIYQSGASSGRTWGAWYHNTSGSYAKVVESFYMTYLSTAQSYVYCGGIGFDHTPGTTNTINYRFNLGGIGGTRVGVVDYGLIYLIEIST